MKPRDLAEAVFNFFLGIGWWVYRVFFCRHDWQKDEVATAAEKEHPLVRDGYLVKGHCLKCAKQKWLSAK